MKHIISEVQVMPIKPINGLVGFASFVLDKCIYCGSIGIYTKPLGGYRLTYPTKKGDINIFHPINKQIALEIEFAVVNKFEEVMNNDRHHYTNVEK